MTKLRVNSAVTVTISSSRRLTRPFFLSFLFESLLGAGEVPRMSDVGSPGLPRSLLPNARNDLRSLCIRELEVRDALRESLGVELLW